MLQEVLALGRAFSGAPGETLNEIVANANTFAQGLVELGLGPTIKQEVRVDPGWLLRQGQPASSSVVDNAETALGFALPPSYRRFLLDAGSLMFCNYWCDETTPIDELARVSQQLVPQILETHGTSPLVQAMQPPQVIRFADFHNHTAEEIFIANFCDADGEYPHFMWMHDDAFGDAGELQHVCSVVEQAASWKAGSAPTEGIVPVTTELTEALAALLARSGSQRDKLDALENELGTRLDAAAGDELICCLHQVRGGIRSPKLRDRRDALVEQWRGDSLPGSAPLPKLARPRAPRPKPRGFGTFEDWVINRVHRQIDWFSEFVRKLEARK